MAFSGRQSRNGNAFRSGQSHGRAVRYSKGHKNRKAITKWTAYGSWVERSKGKKAPAFVVSELGDMDLIREVLETVPVRPDPEREGLWKRQSPEVEAVWNRKHRMYRKCSRDGCKPGNFSCQGYQHFASCYGCATAGLEQDPETGKWGPKTGNKPVVVKENNTPALDDQEELDW